MAIFIGAPSIIETLPLLFVTFLIGGATVSGWNVITISFRQRFTPDHLLGRVNGFNRLLTWGAIPLGALIGGAVGELVGLQTMFAFAATLAALPCRGTRMGQRDQPEPRRRPQLATTFPQTPPETSATRRGRFDRRRSQNPPPKVSAAAVATHGDAARA